MESSNQALQNQWSSSSSEYECYSISSPDTTSPNFPQQSSKLSKPSSPGKKKQRQRSKNPSEQRQNASEKEKLRMRDLTKALHHLRSYLPPSVAPAGQTLTKIETLRLTIRYISFLSAQLGLSEEELSRRKPKKNSCRCSCSPELHESFRPGFEVQEWGLRQGGSAESQVKYVEQDFFDPQQEGSVEDSSTDIDGFLRSQQCAQTTQMIQAYGRNLGYYRVPQALH